MGVQFLFLAASNLHLANDINEVIDLTSGGGTAWVDRYVGVW